MLNFANANFHHPVARTPQSGAENLGVELLLVLADLWSVAVRSNVGGVDVDHGALPVVLSFDWLAFTASCREYKRDEHPNNLLCRLAMQVESGQQTSGFVLVIL